MKKRLKEILNSLPQQPPRSRLEPYSELIEALLAKNWTYRGISRVLAEKCGIRVSPSNLHYFVKHHLRALTEVGEKCSAMRSFPNGAGPNAYPDPVSKVSKRTDERQSRDTSHHEDVFEFDPTVPLRLTKSKE